MDPRNIVAAVFDFDGTMIDSDAALVAPFIELGIPRSQISFGHAVAEECDRLGICLDAYVDHYDTELSQPFPGVESLVAGLGRWSICSNKHPVSARAEIARLGWQPEVAMYADAFDWEHKELGPVLDAMGLTPDQVIMIGDSNGDLQCAEQVGTTMVWAGWNPRVAQNRPDGLVLDRPGDVLDLFPGLRKTL